MKMSATSWEIPRYARDTSLARNFISRQGLIMTALMVMTTFTSVAKADDPRAAAHRLFERLTGVPLLETDPRFAQMVTLITQGQREQAAQIATADSFFYNLTLRNFASVMANKDETTDVGLNDFQATLIGAVRDDLDARTLLTGDYIYKAGPAANLAAPTTTSNEHYEQIDAAGLDLKTVLIRSQPQYQNIPESAGLLTTRTWAKEHMEAGTNRRAAQYSMQEFLCAPITQWKDLDQPDFRVRRDVDRVPGGNPSTFQGLCRGCHSPMDGFAGAFARFDFVNGQTLYYGGSRVAPKYNQNTTVYPEGYVTFDDSFINLATGNQNVSLGWRGPLEGQGIRAFGSMLASSQAFSRCMTTRAFKEVCRRDPGDDDRSAINQLSNDFEDGGYRLKNLFEKVAIQSECIGTM